VLQAELTLLKNTKRWQNVSAILMIWKIVDYVHYLKKNDSARWRLLLGVMFASEEDFTDCITDSR